MVCPRAPFLVIPSSTYILSIFSFSLSSYADDDNPYTCRNKSDLVVEKPKYDSNWINENALIANRDKFHPLLNANGDEIDVDNHRIYNSPQENLWVCIWIINSHLMNILYNKASQKLHALARVSMTTEQCRNIMTAYIF